MGNCYEDTRVTPPQQIQASQIMNQNKNLQPPNTASIISQLRNFPPLSKYILSRIEELGSLSNKNYKDLGKIYQLKNKSIYQGELKNKTFHGQGRLFLPDGTLIESQFLNGQPNNQTRIFKPNGDYFSGKISNQPASLFQGIVQEKGIRYQGEMLNHKPHGKGKQSSKSYIFNGIFQNGKKVTGNFQWNIQNPKIAQCYEGQFENNLFHGYGTLINNEGKYVGQFQNGLKNGNGVFIHSDGSRYQGNFRRNRPDGEGKLFDQNGVMLKQGKWINGKFFLGENL